MHDSKRPTSVAIDHDDYHAEDVGRLADGRQFFLTTPFVAAWGDEPGCEYVALYLFGADGALASAEIVGFEPREAMDADARRACRERMLESLGDYTRGRIEVAPFVIEHGGTEFGLIARAPEEDGDGWAVELMPGNYMAFFEPWDSGEYDT